MVNEAFYRHVGRRLQAARERQQLTQVEVARLLHLTQGTVSRWESGARDIGLEDLRRLAHVLGEDLTYFLPEPAATGSPIEQAISHLNRSERQHCLGLLQQLMANLAREFERVPLPDGRTQTASGG